MRVREKTLEPLLGAALFALGTLLILAANGARVDLHLIVGVLAASAGVAVWIGAIGS